MRRRLSYFAGDAVMTSALLVSSAWISTSSEPVDEAAAPPPC